MIERPSLHALAIFLAVIEHGTMTAAAEAEGISQPAISAQVKALERYYGTTAPRAHGSGHQCRRRRGGWSTTMRRGSWRWCDELGSPACADLDGLRAGELIVGASSTVGEQFLADLPGTVPCRLSQRALVSAHRQQRRDHRAVVAARELDFAIVGEPSGGSRADRRTGPCG